MSSNLPSSKPFSGKPKKTPAFQTNYPGRCLALFGVFFAFAGFFVVMMAIDFLREWRANNLFLEITCAVTGKELVYVSRFRRSGFEPRISIKYAVNSQEMQATISPRYDHWPGGGRSRSEAQDILARFDVGGEYPCWYDPDDPTTVVLANGYAWKLYLVGLIPAAIMIAAGAGMYACWLRLSERPTPTDSSAATDSA